LEKQRITYLTSTDILLHHCLLIIHMWTIQFVDYLYTVCMHSSRKVHKTDVSCFICKSTPLISSKCDWWGVSTLKVVSKFLFWLILVKHNNYTW